MRVQWFARDGCVVDVAGMRVLIDAPQHASSMLPFCPTHRMYPVDDTAATWASPSFQPGPHTLRRVPRLRAPSWLHVLDVSTLDLVLLSSPAQMLALPLLISQPGFAARVLAAPPVLAAGRQLLSELADGLKHAHADSAVQDAAADVPECLPVCSEAEVHAACAIVEPCSYAQSITATEEVTVAAYPSGAAIGGCYWLITTRYAHIVCLSECSVASRHPMPMATLLLDQTASGVTIDALLVQPSALALPTAPPLPQSMAKIGHVVRDTVTRGGNVLLPVPPTGAVYDLFEYLDSVLTSAGLTHVRMLFIGPAARESLAWSNIVGEWLTPELEQRVYLPRAPFHHAVLRDTGRLYDAPCWSHEMASLLTSPCIVFAGHTSLRCGDVVHLLHAWGGDFRNSIILTDPDIDADLALAPYAPLSMAVHRAPLDMRLRAAEVAQLVRHAGHVVLPSDAADDCVAGRAGDAASSSVTRARDLDVLDVPLPRSKMYRRGVIAADLAESLKPQPASGNMFIAQIDASLRQEGHQVRLERPTLADVCTVRRRKRRSVLLGSSNTDAVLAALAKAGMADAAAAAAAPGDPSLLIRIPSLSASIRIHSPDRTTIAARDPATRQRLQAILASTLHQL